jgi:hypothetical protein
VAFGERRAQGRSGNPSPQATRLGGCSGGRAVLECHVSDQRSLGEDASVGAEVDAVGDSHAGLLQAQSRSGAIPRGQANPVPLRSAN